MIATAEDALICDMAEYYRIYDYRSLSVELAATFSVGLMAREDSRIRMKLTGEKVPLSAMLLARISDTLAWIKWSKTKDGQSGTNRPIELVRILAGGIQESNIASFCSGEDFDKERMRLTGLERRK